MPGTKENTE